MTSQSILKYYVFVAVILWSDVLFSALKFASIRRLTKSALNVHVDRGIQQQSNFTTEFLTFKISDVLNENKYLDSIKTLPNKFDTMEQWSRSFDVHIFEEYRSILQQEIEKAAFLVPSPSSLSLSIETYRSPSPTFGDKVDSSCTISDREGGPLENITECACVFVKSANYSEQDGFPSKLLPNFTAKIREDKDFPGQDYFNLEYLYTEDSARFENEDGVDWVMFIFTGAPTIPIERIYNGLLNYDFPADQRFHHELCECSTTNGLTESSSTTMSELDHYHSNQLMLSKLNPSQRDAILTVFSSLLLKIGPRIQIIHGPPGTGKTATLVSLIGTVLSCEMESYKVIACAPTNQATCELARRSLTLTHPSNSHVKLHQLVLVGNRDRLIMTAEGKEDSMYIHSRVKRIHEAMSGWHAVTTAIVYQLFVSQQINPNPTNHQHSSSNRDYETH